MNSPTTKLVDAPTRRGRLVFLLVSAALAIGVMVVAHAVMLPFVLALLIAYVLTPLVGWVERRRLSRPVAILIVYAVVLGTMFGFVRTISPRVSQEVSGLRRELPSLVNRARDTWLPVVQDRLRAIGLAPLPESNEQGAQRQAGVVARPRPDGAFDIDVGSGFEIRQTRDGYVVEPRPEARGEPFDVNRMVAEAAEKSFMYARHNALEVAAIGRSVVAFVSRTIFIFFITLMLAAYIMLTREKILSFFVSLCRPATRGDLLVFLARADRGLSGVVRGQLMICVVNGALSAVGFGLIGLKYWPVLALLAMVFSLIPIFGSIMSSVPAVALALTQSVGTAAFALGWILLIHQLEANLLNPKIMGDAAKIHPVLVVFSLLVGEHFFHTIGALLAVPCMSIAQSLFLHIRYVIQRDDPDFHAEPISLSSLPPPLR